MNRCNPVDFKERRLTGFRSGLSVRSAHTQKRGYIVDVLGKGKNENAGVAFLDNLSIYLDRIMIGSRLFLYIGKIFLL